MEGNNAEGTKDLIKPDVILVWGRNCDFPLWSEFIHHERARFGKVIVAFMDSYLGEDYRDFIIQAMTPDNVVFIAPSTQDELGSIDWRHAAIHKALVHVTSDWVWFTEQDFFPTDEHFWEMVYASANEAEAIGIKEGDRLHPCCLFFKKEALERTNKFFGIVAGESDHFGQIQKDIQVFGIKLVELSGHYKHMAGASHNFRLIYEGGEPNFRPDEFAEYLKKCLQVSVPLDARFTATAKRWLDTREISGNNETPIGE